MTTVDAGLERVRQRIGTATEACGRSLGSVRLVAVSKTQPVARVAEAVAAGQREFGENYLQDALPKLDAFDDRDDLTWHFIGQVQSNKTRAVAERFDWVHTVDRLKLVDRLDAQRPHYASPLNVCIQVRDEDDARRSGIAAESVPELADAIAATDRLRLRGLMIIPPEAANGESARPCFAMLRTLFESLQACGHPLDTLSMGMTGDLEVAIQEGATLVRVGTAIFGARRTEPG
jgi:PLP dependent protein